MMSKSVCLVEMPFSSYTTPCFALSLLKACLNKADISSKIFYANMMLTKYLGVDDYLVALNRVNQVAIFGEALFAPYTGLPTKKSFAEYVDSLKQFSPLANEKYILEIQELAKNVLPKLEKFLDDLSDDILSHNPSIVAFSSMFFQNNACIALSKILKKKCPEIIIMIGGPNVSTCAAGAMTHYVPSIDFAFSGEADEIFAEVCQLLLNKGKDISDDLLPYGIVSKTMYKQNDEEYPLRFTKDLDNTPYPDYDDYFTDLEKYSLKSEVLPSIFVEFSRGCWWHSKKPCTFCGLNIQGNKYRIKSVEHILEELIYLKNKYNLNKITLTDNILSRIHLDELIPKLIDSTKKFSFFVEIKSDLSHQDIKNLRKAGFVIVQPGIESLQDDLLALMNKGNRAIKHLEIIRNLDAEGIYPIWHMLAGFPEEKNSWYEEMTRLIPLISHLSPPRQFTHILYVRYSEYYRNQEKYGLKLIPLGAYDYAYPNLDDFIAKTAHMFMPDGSDINQLKSYIAILEKSKEHAVCDLAILNWRNTFVSNQRERMVVSKNATSLEIMDLRKISKHSIFTLVGLRRKIYELCSTAILERKIFANLVKEFSPEEIEQEIAFLLENYLLIKINDELLALGIEQGDLNKVKLEEVPLGLNTRFLKSMMKM